MQNFLRIVVLMVLSGGSALACELDGSQEERERDLRYQEVLVETSAKKADVIATATVVRIGRTRFGKGREYTPIEFRVWRWLKRAESIREDRPLVLWGELLLVNVICLGSDHFFEDEVRVGDKVIVYANGRRIMRAAPEARSAGEISYGREIEILSSRVGA